MAKVKKKRKKKTPYRRAKEKAWKQFSRYIRKRDCVRTTGFGDQGACFTCGRVYDFKVLHAGHFITGVALAIWADETNVNAQCPGCNLNPPYGKGGNLVEYTIKMIDIHGEEHVNWLREQRHVVKKYSVEELEEIANEYKKKYEQL